MNATELLQLYDAGQRDFRNQTLRGQDFQGKNLSGADFSGADIRSANFSQATLTAARFTGATAGLQRNRAAALVMASVLLAAASGVFIAFEAFFISLIFDANSNQVAGWASLGFLVVFCIRVLWWELNAVAVVTAGAAALLVAIAGGVLVAAIGAFEGTFPIAAAIATTGVVISAVVGTVASAVVGAVASTVVGAVAVIVAVTVAGTEAVAVVVALTSLVAVAVAGVITVAVPVAILLTLVSTYVGYRSLQGDPRDAWLRTTAIALAATGGTRFRQADLTDVDFTDAILTSTDFRDATLTRTRFKHADLFNRIRPGDTYLSSPEIQALLCTGNGDNQDFRDRPNLSGLNLDGASLINADFTGSNLEGSSFSGATLTEAIFIGANLSQVNLQDADLTGALLVQTQLDQANLTGATLTGATIEDWGITPRTQLDGIQCDYVFLHLPIVTNLLANRRRQPDDWNKTFAEGEFAETIVKPKPL